VGLGA